MRGETVIAGVGRGRRASVLLGAVICLAVGNVCLAQAQPTEYDVKAAFLMQFPSYVQWPEERSVVPFVFGVMGAEEIVDNLEQLKALPDGRRILVRKLQSGDDARGLHVLFVENAQSMEAEALMKTAVVESVLTVTEARGARPSDSVVNFELVDGRVRFDVSLTAAQQAQLRISARLLQVALRVIGEP